MARGCIGAAAAVGLGAAVFMGVSAVAAQSPEAAAASAEVRSEADPEVERILGLARQGMALDDAERHAEALPPLGEAYTALAQGAPPQNRWRAQTALALSHALNALKRRDEAISILTHENQALIDAGQDAATDAPAMAHALAMVLYGADRYEEAGAAAQRACDLYARPEHGADPAKCARLDIVRGVAGLPVDLTDAQRAEVRATLDMREMTRAVAIDDQPTADAAFARLLGWFEQTEGAESHTLLEMRGLRAQWRRSVGRVDESLAEAREIHATSARVFGVADPRTLTFLEAYGRAALAAGRGEEALPVLDAAARVAAEQDGAGSAVALRLAMWRGDLLQGMGRYEAAAATLEAGLGAAAALPANDPDRVSARISLAALETMRGRPQASVDALIALLAEQGSLAGVDEERLNQARLSLAEGLTIVGRSDEASQILDSALTVYPADARKTLQLRAMALMLQSLAYRQLGRPAAGLEMAREADAILAERAPLSILRSRASRNLGSTLIALERYGEAGEVLRNTVALEARVLGEDHPETVTTLLALAEAQFESGAAEAASATMTRAVRQAERQFGTGHAFVGTAYNQAALLAWRADDYEGAEELIAAAVANYTASLGAENPQTLLARTNQATILGQLGRRTEALAAYRDVLAARERVLGPDHPAVGTLLNSLASQMQPEVPADEAERMLRRAVEIGRARLDPGDPDRLLWETGLAWQLMQTDRPAEALQWLRGVGAQAAARPGALSVETVGASEQKRLREMFRGQVIAAWRVAHPNG